MTRAFASDRDGILVLFAGGNRVMQDHPEYGMPRFAVVWYEDEDWAILCSPTEAALIPSAEIADFPRQRERAAERVQAVQRIWDESDRTLRIPLTEVARRIA